MSVMKFSATRHLRSLPPLATLTNFGYQDIYFFMVVHNCGLRVKLIGRSWVAPMSAPARRSPYDLAFHPSPSCTAAWITDREAEVTNGALSPQVNMNEPQLSFHALACRRGS